LRVNLDNKQAAMRARERRTPRQSGASQRRRQKKSAYIDPSISEAVEQYARYLEQRLYTEALWELVSQPLKFPAPSRRRREDRDPAKAA
jgi:hypothetical protein